MLSKFGKIFLLFSLIVANIALDGHVSAESKKTGETETIETSENSRQTEISDKITQEEMVEDSTRNIESENSTDSSSQQNSEEGSEEQTGNSWLSDRLRPADTSTAGTLTIEDTRNLSKYDTVNTLKDFTYTVSFLNLTPEKRYKYQTTSNTKYFAAESDGTANLQIVLRANQTVTFSDVANASYTITTSENATSSVSYTAAGDGTLIKTSGQAEIGNTLSSERETVSATSGTVFTFNHQFYYDFIINSMVKSASAISPSARLVFPNSMKGQSIQIEGTSGSVNIGEDATADITVADGQKMILSNISSDNIDQMYDSSELISIPDISGYTSSLTKHIEDNGDITADISYKEYGYQIIYHGNGADDELTETVTDDDIQDTYSFSVKDTSNSHYLYVDLTRSGTTMNYKITLSPIGVMYLRNREGTITVNGVEKAVTLNAPSGKISEVDTGSFEINDTGDTYFSCKVEAKKTHVMTSNWTADFGNNKLGRRTKYEVSKIIDDLTYSEVKNLRVNPYAKTGYRFTGWNTKADGTGTEYTETQEVSKLAAADKDEDSIDLYAQWEKLTDLKVTAAVSGNMGSYNKEFEFTTQFPSSLYGKNLTVEKSNGSTSTVTIDPSGVTSFTLKHGESITFKNLTTEQVNAIKALSDLGIKERDVSSDGYSTVYSVSSELNGTLVVSYRNTRQSAVPTGNHIGTGITVAILIGISGLAVTLRKKIRK